MLELLPITLFGILFAGLSHYYSEYDLARGQYRRKERLFYTIMAVGLILFAGLRTGYNDTNTYLVGYDKIANDPDWYNNRLDWTKIGTNPGFVLAQGILSELGASRQSFLMIFSIFTLGVNLWFIRKYSCNIWLSIVLFIMYAGFTFNLAAIKQCTAMAFCMIATDRAIHKKYLRFLLYVVLGCLFHPYAIMYIVVPFLFFRPWSKYTVVMLIVFAFVGVGLESLLGTLLNATDMLGEEYNAASFTGEGVNPVRLLVTAVPVFLSLMVAKQISKNDEKDQHVIVNLTMLNAEIMFVALFGTANYFARLANYFLPFQAVSIPWLLKQYDYKDRKTITTCAVIGYALFFIYSYSINEKFDRGFFSITLWKYLDDIFTRLIA